MPHLFANSETSIPQREILWNVSSLTMGTVYLLSFVCIGWIVAWLFRRSLLWQRGRTTVGQLSWSAGIQRLADYLLTHRVIARDRYAGVMHRLIFWGFVILVISTTLVGIQHHGHIVFLTGNFYLVFSLFSDLGGVAFIAGIAMALWRRREVGGQQRLLSSAATTAMLWCLLVLAVTGFVVEAARIAVDFPEFEHWSPVGFVLARGLQLFGITGETARKLHAGVWVLHAGVVMVFLAIVPLSLLKHILVGSYSVMRPAGRPGVLAAPAVPLTHAADFDAFRQVDLMQADACLTCGLCTTVCPAEAAGKPLSPRSVVLGLRSHLDRPDVALTEQVADDALWSCTTCNACDTICPVNIHIVQKIVTLRRGRVAVGEIPGTAAEALESAAQKFNPYGRANSARMEWASGLNLPVAQPDEPVELLYWVGCGGAFDPAGQAVARSMVQILNHLQISYRVLGCRERCTGDPARRLGEEGLWSELAATNQATIASHGVKTILANCPHCFNSFKNEYPSVGPMPRVMHHTQWLEEKLQDGSLKTKTDVREKVTFHDPCYLSRANDETAAPRAVLDRIYDGSRVEMAAHGKQSFCCGGGGGQLWLDVRGRTRVETIRAEQVEQTESQTVATGCPFCRLMLEAGRANLAEGQGKWRVRDLAELVAENLVEDRG